MLTSLDNCIKVGSSEKFCSVLSGEEFSKNQLVSLLISAIRAEEFSEKIVIALLQKGASPFLPEGKFKTIKDVEKNFIYLDMNYKIKIDIFRPTPPPFCVAFKDGNVKICSLFLKFAARTAFKHIALYHACFFGFPEEAELLIEAGASVTQHNNILLKTCALLGRKEIAAILLERGADPKEDSSVDDPSEEYAKNGNSFKIACREGGVEMVDLILSHYGDLSSQEEDCLLIACSKNFNQLAKKLANLGVKSEYCLEIACENQNDELFFFFFSQETTLEQRDRAIRIARTTKQIKALLQAGVSERAKSECLIRQKLASEKYMYENVKLLLEDGVKWYCEIEKNDSRLRPVLPLLIKAGVKLDKDILSKVCSNFGENFPALGSSGGENTPSIDYEFAESLLTHGRDNLTSQDLNSSLRIMLEKAKGPKDISLIKTLISAGAELEKSDFRGELLPRISVDFLLDAGYDINYIFGKIRGIFNSEYFHRKFSLEEIEYLLSLGLKTLDVNYLTSSCIVFQSSPAVLKTILDLYPGAEKKMSPYFSHSKIAEIKKSPALVNPRKESLSNESEAERETNGPDREAERETNGPDREAERETNGPDREVPKSSPSSTAQIEIQSADKLYSFSLALDKARKIGLVSDSSPVKADAFKFEAGPGEEKYYLLLFSQLLGLVKTEQLSREEKVKLFLLQKKHKFHSDENLIFSAFGWEAPADKKEILYFLLQHGSELMNLGFEDVSSLYGK